MSNRLPTLGPPRPQILLHRADRHYIAGVEIGELVTLADSHPAADDVRVDEGSGGVGWPNGRA